MNVNNPNVLVPQTYAAAQGDDPEELDAFCYNLAVGSVTLCTAGLVAMLLTGNLIPIRMPAVVLLVLAFLFLMHLLMVVSFRVCGKRRQLRPAGLSWRTAASYRYCAYRYYRCFDELNGSTAFNTALVFGWSFSVVAVAIIPLLLVAASWASVIRGDSMSVQLPPATNLTVIREVQDLAAAQERAHQRTGRYEANTLKTATSDIPFKADHPVTFGLVRKLAVSRNGQRWQAVVGSHVLVAHAFGQPPPTAANEQLTFAK